MRRRTIGTVAAALSRSAFTLLAIIAAVSGSALVPEASAATGPGSLVTWGDGGYGQAQYLPAGDDVVAVAAGVNHAVALRSDGTLACWAENCAGTPTGGGFTAVAAGHFYSVALRNDGTLAVWVGPGLEQSALLDPPTGNDFVGVAAGYQHGVALRSDGSLSSWGDPRVVVWPKFYDTTVVSGTPTGGGFTAVAAGFGHSVALRSDGTLVSWGYDGFREVSDTPTGGDFVAVAAGDYHSVALRSDGSLVSWGDDRYGQVSGTPAGNDFVAVDGGGLFSVALRSDGTLVSWGFDGFFQVSNTPTDGGFVAVSAGGTFSLAIRQPDGGLPGDTEPPVISVPAGVVADATGPGGAGVAYEASATDDVDGSLPVTCSPASASLFPVGDTTVACEAADAAGNTAEATFVVHVRGAAEQLAGLADDSTGAGPGTSLADKASAAAAALASGDVDGACATLGAYLNQVHAHAGKKLTAEQAEQLEAAAERIRAVVGC